MGRLLGHPIGKHVTKKTVSAENDSSLSDRKFVLWSISTDDLTITTYLGLVHFVKSETGIIGAMDNLTVTGGSTLGVQYVEDLLQHFPQNPISDPFGRAWGYMTDNYSKFQIATLGSLIVHEVNILCVLFGLNWTVTMVFKMDYESNH